MQKEEKKGLLTRFMLGQATSKEKDKVYSLPESEQMLKGQWNNINPAELPKETRERMLNNIYLKTIRQPFIHRFAPLIRVAAVLLVGLIIAGIIYSGDIFSGHSPKMLSIQSPAGQRTPLTLPDGSKVILAGSSLIEYPESFDKKCREVSLSGMAFFDVAKSESLPFHVNTSEITVSVLGTQFSVASYPGDPLVQTVLVSGKVQVTCNENYKSVELIPGEQHTYNSMSKSGSVSKVDAQMLTQWADGKLVFDQEDIYSVCRKLERWYGVEIEISNPGRNNDLYTFTIDKNTLAEVLLLMQKISPMSYSKTDDVITISFTK